MNIAVREIMRRCPIKWPLSENEVRERMIQSGQNAESLMIVAKSYTAVFLILVFVCTLPLSYGQDKPVELITFFGQQGFDTAAILKSLPFREGSAVPFGGDTPEGQFDRWKASASDAIRRSIGRDATDVAVMCCGNSGGWLVYI